MREGNLSRLGTVVASGTRVEMDLLRLLEEAIASELPPSRLKFGVALGAAAWLRDQTVWDALVADACKAGVGDAADAALVAAAEFAADADIAPRGDGDFSGLVATIRLSLKHAFARDRGALTQVDGLLRCARVARLIHALSIARVAQKDQLFRSTLAGADDRAPRQVKRKSTLAGVSAPPVSERAPISEPVPSLARIPESDSPIMLRVLVVSPEAATRRALTRLLAPFEVVDVDGPAATIGLLTSYRAFDVVLLDESDDELAAYKLARTIRESWPTVGDRIFFVRKNFAVPISDPDARIPLVRAELVEAAAGLRRRALAR